jgi:hypothetical protein
MNKDDPEIHTQGIQHNYESLMKLIEKLDKEIWIKEFWYSMKDRITEKFPGQIKVGDSHALPVPAVKDWAELVKRYL